MSAPKRACGKIRTEGGPMAMRIVDRRLFIGDEGRPIFYAGLFHRQPYYIPADDVETLNRRRFWTEALAFVVFLAAIGGAAVQVWSAWWCIVAFAGLFLTPSATERWVRQRYAPVTDPAVVRDVRQTSVLNGPTLGGALALFVLNVPQYFSWFASHRRGAFLAFVACMFVGQIVELLLVRRDRMSADPGSEYVPPSTGITR
jgi:hypothetical protein